MAQTDNVDFGCLYIVPTPIGNLADMVPRAIDVLQTVDLIAAEDTRHSAKLLQYFQIQTPMTAYHEHSDEHKLQSIISRLIHGEKVALISDAGTPLVSDPGYRLVRVALEHRLKVIPIPGACAAIAALSASGLPSDRFSFEGFPPAKSGSRMTLFNSLSKDTRTLIFYESPHRILASLQDMANSFGEDREAVIAREVSKTFETFLFGELNELIRQVSADEDQRRGEIVVLVKGYQAVAGAERIIHPEAQELLRLLRLEGLPVKRASGIASQVFNLKKNALYDWAIQHLS